jgi:hypothetical protein
LRVRRQTPLDVIAACRRIAGHRGAAVAPDQARAFQFMIVASSGRIAPLSGHDHEGPLGAAGR